MAILLWLVVFTGPFKVIYDQLGMTELPWITEVAITIRDFAAQVLPALALALLIWGGFALKRASRRTLNRMTAINFIVAALMPGLVYFTVHMPLIKLQSKLGGGS